MPSFKLIIENAKSIAKKLTKAVGDYLNKLFFRKAKSIEVDIRQLVSEAIARQPEYKSLLGGKLQSELGVPHTQPRLDQIVRIIVDSIHVNVVKSKTVGNEVVAGLEVKFVKENFKDLLDSPAATYMTDKGVTIEWLRWLLLEGDKLIVRNYMVGVDPGNYARTGLGQIMIPSGRSGPGFYIPPEFRGVAEDNFITRALLEVQTNIDALFERALSGR